jgi:ribosomal 50S subunit-recycling heat shock protein
VLLRTDDESVDKSRDWTARLRLLKPGPLPVVYQTRGKKKGKGQQKQEEFSDDEENSDDDEDKKKNDDDGLGFMYQDITISVPSLRMDVVLKTATFLGRVEVEGAFYDGRIRINGEKIGKKSQEVAEGDQCDIILGRNSENNEFLDICRTDILTIADIASGKGRVKVNVRKHKLMVVDNYPEPNVYDGVLLYTRKLSKDE